MTVFRRSCIALAGVLAAACAELPSEPTVTVMPGPYKPFEVFQAEDQLCRGYAQQQVGAAAGSSYGYQSDYYLQYRYNVAYEQCMYAKDNLVPGFAPPASVPPPPR